jgi:hypothetical protein
MRHSFFKYFSKMEYADAFLAGNVFCRSLRYFADYEDGQVRGDTNEGTLAHSDASGLMINNLTQGRPMLLPGGTFKATVKQGDIFVFCLSMSLTERIWNDFNSVVCVEVHNKRMFLQRVREAAESGGNEVYTGQVGYRDVATPPKHIWALPEKVSISKLVDFKWQDEYRIVFGHPEVFAVNNVDLIITDRNHTFDKRPEDAIRTCTLDIGSITSLCRVHLGPK